MTYVFHKMLRASLAPAKFILLMRMVKLVTQELIFNCFIKQLTFIPVVSCYKYK